jgi:hypothetical protein
VTQQAATIIGICLQLLGSAWLVWAARSTVKKLQHFQVSLTYDRMGDAVGVLAAELKGQFIQQFNGFVLLLAGAGFQIYAAF